MHIQCALGNWCNNICATRLTVKIRVLIRSKLGKSTILRSSTIHFGIKHEQKSTEKSETTISYHIHSILYSLPALKLLKGLCRSNKHSGHEQHVETPTKTASVQILRWNLPHIDQWSGLNFWNRPTLVSWKPTSKLKQVHGRLWTMHGNVPTGTAQVEAVEAAIFDWGFL